METLNKLLANDINYIIFGLIVVFYAMEHSNIELRIWLDKTLGLVFTTPNMHKVHHDQYYTDSNYADIFIIWDRIFGTFKYKPAETIKFGLKEIEEATNKVSGT